MTYDLVLVPTCLHELKYFIKSRIGAVFGDITTLPAISTRLDYHVVVKIRAGRPD